MTFQRMKIKTPTVAQQRSVQEHLLDLGYWWHQSSGDTSRIKWIGECAAIYTEKNGQLFRDTSNNFEYFDQEEQGEEYTLVNGEFVKVAEYFKQPKSEFKEKEYAPLPLDIIPKAEWERNRKIDLMRAMLDKLEKGGEFPQEWHEEYNELYWAEQNRKQFMQDPQIPF